MRPYIGGSILIVALWSTTGCGISGQPEKKGLIAKFEKDALGRIRRGSLGPGSFIKYNVEMDITSKSIKKTGILYGTMECKIREGSASPNGNRTLESIGTTTFDRNPEVKFPTPVPIKSVRVMEVMPSGELRTLKTEFTFKGRFLAKKYKFSQELPQWIEENRTYAGYDVIAPNEKVSWKANFEESRRISTKGGNFDCLLGTMKRSSKTERAESTGYYCPAIDNYVTFSERSWSDKVDMEAKYDLIEITLKPLR